MVSTMLDRLSILSFLLLSAACYLEAAAPNNPQAFVQCFLNSTGSNNSTLVLSPETAPYVAVFNSTVRNERFITLAATKPTAIVVATTASDVQAAVTCANACGLRVRVRSGGHDYEGQSYVSSGDPFVLLDLSGATSVNIVSPDNVTAWIGAGATIGEVYYHVNVGSNNQTAAFPSGMCTTVGVGGMFSAGGIGTLMRKFGTSADNIIDALVVDINGDMLDRETMGEDLFWAIRGGGAASFGVVLAFKVNLVQVPPTVTVFTVKKTASQGAMKLVERWQHVAPQLDRNVFLNVDIQAVNQNGSSGDRALEVGFGCLFLGGKEELLSILGEGFPELGIKAEDCTEMSWVESTLYWTGAQTKDPALLLDRRLYFNDSFKAKSDFVKEPITEEGLEKISEFLLGGGTQEPVRLLLDPLGGRMDEINETDIPFPHRKGNLYIIQYIIRWTGTNETESQRHLEWMRSFQDFLAPYVSKNPRAAYLGYKDIDLGSNVNGTLNYTEASEWGQRYFLNNFERLVRVKARVDPQNFFWNEQSIPRF